MISGIIRKQCGREQRLADVISVKCTGVAVWRFIVHHDGGFTEAVSCELHRVELYEKWHELTDDNAGAYGTLTIYPGGFNEQSN